MKTSSILFCIIFIFSIFQIKAHAQEIQAFQNLINDPNNPGYLEPVNS